ncbi:MAG TPA: carboxypeptidase regulatory-like domain-containing protein, partial [Isosphaeraceae bacterium]
MRTLRIPVRLLPPALALVAVGCASVSGGRPGVAPQVRTITSVGDKPLPVVSGTPGDAVASGRVRPERRPGAEGRISGRVLDDRGRAVPGAEVRLAVDGAAKGTAVRATTDRAGGFTLHGLRPGATYTVIAEWEDEHGLHSGRADARAPEARLRISLREPGDLAPATSSRVDRVSDRAEVDAAEVEAEEPDDAAPVNVEDLPPAAEAEDLRPDPSERPAAEPAAPEARPRRTGWRRGGEVAPRVPEADVVAASNPAPPDPDPAPDANGGDAEAPDGAAPDDATLDDEGPNPLPAALEPPAPKAPAARPSRPSTRRRSARPPAALAVPAPRPADAVIEPAPPPAQDTLDPPAVAPAARPSVPWSDAPAPADVDAARPPQPGKSFQARPRETPAPGTTEPPDPRPGEEPMRGHLPDPPLDPSDSRASDPEPPPVAAAPAAPEPQPHSSPASAVPSAPDPSTPGATAPDLPAAPDLSAAGPDAAQPAAAPDPPAVELDPARGSTAPEAAGMAPPQAAQPIDDPAPPAVPGAAEVPITSVGPNLAPPAPGSDPGRESHAPRTEPEGSDSKAPEPDAPAGKAEPADAPVPADVPPPAPTPAEAAPAEPDPMPAAAEEQAAASPRRRPTWGELPPPRTTRLASANPRTSPARSSLFDPRRPHAPRTANAERGTAPEAAAVPASCQFDAKQRKVVDFVLPDLQGRPVRFQELDSDLVLIDFWGTWCAPCLNAIPHLVELQDRY